MALDLQKSIDTVNVVTELDEDLRGKISDYVLSGVEADERSREPWMTKNEEYLKMALQVCEQKSFPWPNAANVKYPLLTIAGLQFQARAMPAILGDGKGLVRGKVIGYDPSGIKAEKAERIGKHMSFQLLEEMPDWEADMDKLLLVVPLCGTAFKKVYWDDYSNKSVIDLVFPDNLIVNYWAKSMETARRITQRLYLYHNEVISRQRAGKYIDEDIPAPQFIGESQEKEALQKKRFSEQDEGSIPHEILECHTYWDMDEDGYEEPWIFTVDRASRMLLRAVPNFDLKSIRKNAENKIIEIRPNQYFVKYGFIPSPDGGFYDVGFGILLGSLNETASTLINQLLDAGTMANTGGGLLGKGIKLKGGQLSFGPNEWKQIQFTGDDLRKHVFPLPIREPSSVLLSLLQLIISSGKEIISISEISTGKLPGQNTPATTTLSSIEEGLKLFNSIYKRIYRAEKNELRLLFKLNQKYLDEEAYFNILDAQTGQSFTGQVSKEEDYNDETIDVVPTADPNTVSESIRLIKSQQLVELIPLGGVNPVVASQRILQALDIPNPQELMPQPQPDPKTQAIQMKAQADQQKSQLEQQMMIMEMEVEKMKAQVDLMKKQAELEMDQRKMGMESAKQVMDMRLSQEKFQQEAEMMKGKHAMTMMGEVDKMQLRKAQNEQKMKELKSGGATRGRPNNKQRRLG